MIPTSEETANLHAPLSYLLIRFSAWTADSDILSPIWKFLPRPKSIEIELTEKGAPITARFNFGSFDFSTVLRTFVPSAEKSRQ